MSKTIHTSSMRPVGNLNEEHILGNVASLNGILADEYALFTKTLNYHWNVTGPRFHSIHKFLEGHYRSLLEVMDGVAERVRILGETPLSTMKSMNEVNQLNEKNGGQMSASEMIDDLYHGHLQLQTEIRNVLEADAPMSTDPGTEDFLISLLQKHEEMSWMLKSHLD
jgi:starvation-inducible DNA-binding protein